MFSGLILVTLVVAINAECFLSKSIALVTKYGTVDTHCTFKNITVLPGSAFKLPAPDCLKCICTAEVMTCCGFGFHAGVTAPPPGCVAHNDACKLIYVKANNASVICKPGKAATVATTKKPLVTRRPK